LFDRNLFNPISKNLIVIEYTVWKAVHFCRVIKHRCLNKNVYVREFIRSQMTNNDAVKYHTLDGSEDDD